MPQTYHAKSMGELVKLFAKHQKAREQRVLRGVRRTVRQAVSIIRDNVPVAFGELRDETHAVTTAKGGRAVVDSPHAAPVETGSRPHMPPIEPILAWVKLRGMQGLQSNSKIDRMPGSTTGTHARSVASTIRSKESGGAVSVDAPMQIARAIQMKIAKSGTEPHWYARRSLPEIVKALDGYVRAEMFREE